MADKTCPRCGEPVPKGRRSWCSDTCREESRRVAPRPAAADFVEQLDVEATNIDFLAEWRKACQERDRYKKKTQVLIDATYEAVSDALKSATLPAPIPPPPVDKRKKNAEVAIAVMSDWQLSKITPDYNSAVCKERIERYAQKVIELAEIQRADHPVNECRVYLLGDLVEGELIFPGQAHQIDSSLFTQVCSDGPEILSNFLLTMEAHFQKVHVVGVTGNHGRLGGRASKEMHPESNADAMMMEVTRKMLREHTRITWAPNVTPGDRHWYAIDEIGSKRFFMFHGDQIRGGFAGYPWYSSGRRVQGWFTAMMNIWNQKGFDYALHGHFHTPNRTYLNGITVWANGATESLNPYALQELSAAGEPCQWLLFAHPNRGVTAEYLVDLQ